MTPVKPILTDSEYRCSEPAEERGAVTLSLLATALLHAGVAVLLWQGWAPVSALPPAETPSLRTQLITLPTPQPEPIAEPPATPPPPEPAPPPPVVEAPPPKPVVDEAAIARRRVAEEQQRQRELQQQRQAQEQARKLAEQQRLAEAAAAEQQRRDALAREQAQAHAAAEAARAAAERQYRPISKPEPDYPRRALAQKLEGDCTVEYDVTASGHVDNPRLVAGACDNPLFARPSLAAAKDFIYQPRLVDGQPVTVAGVRNTFRYRLSQ
ncbi:energy transducer TonB [Halopseudomonas maritima]|uniref:energy transducer TonB n=1 Tax=Halopseudomonas maritima TaxID=2918528 RepID=UPI001EEA154B|nr:energy transducer TonB [Halopseudomonas maritima]UJJ31458.1 energy transducer TonB [Halopseudomonas maritima]